MNAFAFTITLSFMPPVQNATIKVHCQFKGPIIRRSTSSSIFAKFNKEWFVVAVNCYQNA